jgi:hypothetical protein
MSENPPPIRRGKASKCIRRTGQKIGYKYVSKLRMIAGVIGRGSPYNLLIANHLVRFMWHMSWPLVLALSVGGAVSPMEISW